MKVFFGGDFMPHDAHARAVADMRAYVDSMRYALADLRVVNLECPLLPAAAPLDAPRAAGPHGATAAALGVRDASCAALRRLRVDAVSLANNHIFDHGVEGAAATIRHLRAAGIAHVGAGMSEAEAHRPFTFANRWGLWGYCHAHPIYLRDVPFADGDTPGVAELTVRKVFRDLDEETMVDRAVLYVHWGREHACLPLAAIVQLASTLLEHPKVRLIVGSHPHRLQGLRRTRRGLVAFSLGHFHMPGFVITPPLVMDGFERGTLPVTRSFHEVRTPTFKSWPARARLSAGLVLETGTSAVDVVPLWQAKTGTRVHELREPARSIVRLGVTVAGAFTHLPAPLLRVLHRIGGTVAYANYVHWLARRNGLRFAAAAVRSLLWPAAATRDAAAPPDR